MPHGLEFAGLIPIAQRPGRDTKELGSPSHSQVGIQPWICSGLEHILYLMKAWNIKPYRNKSEGVKAKFLGNNAHCQKP